MVSAWPTMVASGPCRGAIAEHGTLNLHPRSSRTSEAVEVRLLTRDSLLSNRGETRGNAIVRVSTGSNLPTSASPGTRNAIPQLRDSLTRLLMALAIVRLGRVSRQHTGSIPAGLRFN